MHLLRASAKIARIMGISLDPNDYAYGVNCPCCFDAGKTPLNMPISIGGMKRGDGWAPGLPQPPNGICGIPQVAACRWFGWCGVFLYNFWICNPGSGLLVLFMGAQPVFGWSSDANCDFAGANSIGNGPLQGFYGGDFAAAFAESGGISSLSDIAELMNMVPSANLKSEFWPLDANNFVPMFVNQKERTKIWQKIDLTHRDQYIMFDK